MLIMSGLTRIRIALPFVCFCILSLVLILPCALAQDIEAGDTEQNEVSSEEQAEVTPDETPDADVTLPEADIARALKEAPT